MQLFSALQALELVTITVVLVRESTLTVTTPLARVRRSNIVHVDAVFFGFVRDVALEFAERPLLELTGVRDALTDMLQVLERNRRAIVQVRSLKPSIILYDWRALKPPSYLDSSTTLFRLVLGPQMHE